MSIIIVTPLVFVALWLGLRWPFRRALLVSLVIGLVADALAGFMLTRSH